MNRIFFFVPFIIFSFTTQAQNIGIGTTTPTYPLTVISDANSKGIVQKSGASEIGFYTTNGTAYLQTWTAIDLNFATNNGTSKFTIANSSGFVGINILSPTAQLDINGTLRIRGNGAGIGNILTSDANGNASWQVPAAPVHSDVYSLSGMDFSATFSNNTLVKGNSVGGVYYTSAVGTERINAPVHLPNGAKVTKISYSFYDNTAQNFTFQFGYENFANGGFSASFDSSPTGAAANYRTTVYNFATPYVIDNTNGGYYISAYTNWPGTSDMAVKGVLIEYTY